MATGKSLNGKPYAGNRHVRFDEGKVAPAATPRRGSLLYGVRIGLLTSIAVGAVAGLAAATVTLDPGNGVATNVTARFTGATDLVINSGTTGGGIVTLANPLSTYTGKTTVNSGTLVVPDGDVAKGRSSIGAAGPIVLGQGTLRASGTLGAVVTNTYAASSAYATVLDVQDELHITNDFVQKGGAFVKTGPGTVYFSGARNNFGGQAGVAGASGSFLKSDKNRLVFNSNGDAPTQGLRGAFVVAEGTMVIEGGYNSFGNNTGNAFNSIGTWTVENGNTEKSAVLEIRGGTNIFSKSLWPGFYNGFAGTTGGAGVSSGLRVTGGVVTNGLVPSADSVFMGGDQSTPPSGQTGYDTYPFIEMTGGYMYIPRNFQLSNVKGAHSRVDLSGDAVLEVGTQDKDRYLGFGYVSGPSQGRLTLSDNARLWVNFIQMGDAANASTWDVTLKDNASVFARYIRIASNNSKGTLNLNLLGGTLTTSNSTAILRGAAGSKVNVVLDGGKLANELANNSTIIDSALNSIKVGTRGVTFLGNRNINWKWQYISKTFTYTNSAPDEVRQPIVFSAPDSSHNSLYRVANNCCWDGPVMLDPYTRLDLMTNAVYAANHELALSGGNWLRITGGPRTFGTLSFTRKASESSGIALHLHADSPITVTDAVTHPGRSVVGINLYAADGGFFANPLVTPGIYTMIDAPVASMDVLKDISFTYDNAPAGTMARLRLVTEGNRVKLQAVVSGDSAASLAQNAWSNGTSDGLWKTDGNWDGGTAVNSASAAAVFSKDAAAGGETVTLVGQAAAGGIAFSGANGYTVTGGELLLGSMANISSVAPTTNAIASKLTATTPVTVNPAITGGGVVKLTGDLSELAAGLAVNSGTLEVDDLSFATDVTKLVVGSGTFAYTGTEAAEIGGLTVAAGATTGAVIRTDAPLTLRAMATSGNTGLVKTGEDTLRLKGNGVFDLSKGGCTTAWSGDGIYIGASGDGPTSGMYGVTVREGRLEIGTVGDDSDAPTVTAFSFAVGGQPLTERAPGEIVMNNGTVTLQGALKVDGYLGGTATNRLVVNGGTLSVANDITVGLATRAATDTLAPAVLELNGGLLESRTGALKLALNNNEMELFLNEGATLQFVGQFEGGGSDANPRGVAHFNGGIYVPKFGTDGSVVYMRYLRRAYLGEKGLVIDTSHYRDYSDQGIGYLHLRVPFEKDPALGDAKGGGIRVIGNDILYLGANYSNNGDTGDITVEDGTTLMAYRTTGTGPTVKIRPGGTLRTYQSGAYPLYVDSLVLGAEGTSKAARFEARATEGRTIYNCTISNDFQVLGPVYFATRGNWQDTALGTATGVYTAFVYRASCDANVGLENFSLDPAMASLAASFAKVDVTLGGDTGWKAVVATVRSATAADRLRWTSATMGGNWSNGDNWEGGVAPGAQTAAVTFAPAGTVDVPVTLDMPVTVGRAYFEATAAGCGYTIGGSSLLFAASGSEPVFEAGSGGKVTVNVPVSSSGSLYINASQSDENRGTAGEVVFGNGTLDGFDGVQLFPRSGRVTIPSLAWVKDPSQFWIGYGTTRYTGTGETIPGFVARPSISYRSTNLQIDNDLTILSTYQEGNGQFMKSGDGTLYLKGSGMFAFGSNHTRDYTTAKVDANHMCANGDMPTNAIASLSVGAGKIEIGEPGDGESGPTVKAASRIVVGLPAGGDSDSELVVNGGTLSITNKSGDLYVGYYCGTNSVIRPRLTLNDGRIVVPRHLYTAHSYTSSADYRGQTCSPEVIVNGGTLDVGNTLYLNNGFATSKVATSAKTATRFEIDGGVVNVATNAFLLTKEGTSNRTPDAYVYLNGGELNVGSTLNFSRCSKSTAELWLNPGGLLRVGDITAKHPGSKMFFNGGVFSPYGALANGTAAATLEASNNPIDFIVTTNGAVISTVNAKGGQYTVSAALKHDPALSGKDGGLVKTGAGVLTLSGANTYTGPTVVDQGTLAVPAAAPLTDDTVVRAGALLDLGGARTIANLTGDGTVCGDLTLAGALTPQNGIPTVDGDFATVPTACVDFGCTGDDMVPYGSKHLVLRVTGAVDSDIKFKAINCGQPATLAATVENGHVYVLVKSGGTVLLFR